MTSFDLGPIRRRVSESIAEAERAGAQVILDEARKGIGQGPPRGPNEWQDLAERSSVRSVETGAEVYFPGPYAAYLHERLDLHHPGGGTAKYAEIAFATRKDDALAKAAEVIRKAIES